MNTVRLLVYKEGKQNRPVHVYLCFAPNMMPPPRIQFLMLFFPSTHVALTHFLSHKQDPHRKNEEDVVVMTSFWSQSLWNHHIKHLFEFKKTTESLEDKKKHIFTKVTTGSWYLFSINQLYQSTNTFTKYKQYLTVRINGECFMFKKFKKR